MLSVQTKHGSYQFTFHNNKHKMNGMISLNTSTLNNSFCVGMMKKKEHVCNSCYAKTLESMRPNVRNRYELNSVALAKKLKPNELPHIQGSFVRFNSFGELINLTHYKNMIAIAEANPHTTFTLWTKRTALIKNAIANLDNLIHVYSSPTKNVESKLPKGFNKVFTVFNLPYVRENNVEINCTKSCRSCLLCYTHNDTVFVRELIR